MKKLLLIAMLLSSGINVKNCELCSTPAMFMTTKLMDCDACKLENVREEFYKNIFSATTIFFIWKL